MSKKIQLLDCTLRDGAYIVNAEFGVPAIKGIIKRMQDANVDIVECGWLKDAPYKKGTPPATENPLTRSASSSLRRNTKRASPLARLSAKKATKFIFRRQTRWATATLT